MPERTPECRAALGLLRGERAAGVVEACGGALFDEGDNLEVRAPIQPDASHVIYSKICHYLSRGSISILTTPVVNLAKLGLCCKTQQLLRCNATPLCSTPADYPGWDLQCAEPHPDATRTVECLLSAPGTHAARVAAASSCAAGCLQSETSHVQCGCRCHRHVASKSNTCDSSIAACVELIAFTARALQDMGMTVRAGGWREPPSDVCGAGVEG